MRFYFNKYSSPVSSVRKSKKELDSYELYWSIYLIKLVLQLYVFFKAVASYMLFLIKVLKSSEMTL